MASCSSMASRRPPGSWAPVARRLAARGPDGRDGPAWPRPLRCTHRRRRLRPRRPGGGRRSPSRRDRGCWRTLAAGSSSWATGSGRSSRQGLRPRSGRRCAALVLIDGGWEDLETATGMDADEFLRGLDEPPEVMRSLRAFLADRRGFDPATWDADQEAAARATVVETHAGSRRPGHAAACARGQRAGDVPRTTRSRRLRASTAPVTALDGRR